MNVLFPFRLPEPVSTRVAQICSHVRNKKKRLVMLESSPCSGRGLRDPKFRVGGFSLVEVSVAIGIVAFAFVALFALLPQGASTFRKTIEVGVSSQIAQKVISDLQQMEFDELVDSSNSSLASLTSFRWPMGTQGETRFFDEGGNEVLVDKKVAVNPKTLSPQQLAKISYWVNVRVVPKALVPGGGSGLRQCPDLAQVTVQVAFNPSGQPLDYGAGTGGGSGLGGAASGVSVASGTENMIVPRPGVSILNYPVLISRGL
jgi:uncharacterized protein (TIGR02598 family)